jgi:hypothetical protein
VDVEVIATADQTELKVNGSSVLKLSPGESRRTAFGFHVANGELRVKAPKLEVPQP